MKIAGFDWDAGNWPKCGKHDISARYMHEKEVTHYERQIEIDPHASQR